ncbi:MAG: 16S rRNA (uracil(1498)-N(3))-methyltransferase [Acidimicrobiia bacterium]|nr:16S rRNA (uracil(1498)-N(3))-methyltransferase [Acidimicrobiia bacterium]
MGHVPHVLVEGPWKSDTLTLNESQSHHLGRVLRASPDDPVTYTDGMGVIGAGTLAGLGAISRSQERTVPKPRPLDLAVAPPAGKDRARFLVEKLGELGVTRLLWLRTVHGSNRVPATERARAWARAALEQSLGAWLMEVGDALVDWTELEAPIVACDPGSGSWAQPPRTVAIGPEGGWAPDEIPPEVPKWGLSPNVLRVETAAIVGASLVLAREPH